MAVTEATGSGNGRERVDGNGVTTATASLLVTVLEPILEEYAVEARVLSKVAASAVASFPCSAALFRFPAVLGPPSLSVSQERFR